MQGYKKAEVQGRGKNDSKRKARVGSRKEAENKKTATGRRTEMKNKKKYFHAAGQRDRATGGWRWGNQHGEGPVTHSRTLGELKGGNTEQGRGMKGKKTSNKQKVNWTEIGSNTKTITKKP